MSGRSMFFPVTGRAAGFIARQAHEHKIRLQSLSYFALVLGLAAPFPLLFQLYFPETWLRLLAPVLMAIYVLLDYSVSEMEKNTGQKCWVTALLPVPPAVPIFLWYEVIYCEMVYKYTGLALIRYFNLFAVFCAVAGLLLIYGYLKLQNEPPRIGRFTERLARFGSENEKAAPFNYISLSFKVLKQDLVVCILLLLSFFNIYLLYVIMTLAAIGFLGFSAYSMVLFNVVGGSGPESGTGE